MSDSFEDDLLELERIRREHNAATAKLHETGFLLEFIDKLWKEYSRISGKYHLAIESLARLSRD